MYKVEHTMTRLPEAVPRHRFGGFSVSDRLHHHVETGARTDLHHDHTAAFRILFLVRSVNGFFSC
jgi:hypothetical protein